VLVALFIQKSDGNTAAETIFLLGLGAIGVLLLMVPVVGLIYFGRRHEHELRWIWRTPVLSVVGLVIGALLLWVAFDRIDREDTDYRDTAGADEFTVIGDGVALANLQIAESETLTRVLVTVINTELVPIVLSRAEFRLDQEDPNVIGCAGNFPTYTLDDRIAVSDGEIVDASASAESGSMEGFTVHVDGRLRFFCLGSSLTVSLPVSIDLGPQETSALALDFPLEVRAVLDDIVLYDESPEDYPIGQRETVVLPFNLTERADLDVIIASVKVGGDDPTSMACVATRLDELAVSGSSSESEMCA
jgi:hypothetical protein